MCRHAGPACLALPGIALPCPLPSPSPSPPRSSWRCRRASRCCASTRRRAWRGLTSATGSPLRHGRHPRAATSLRAMRGCWGCRCDARCGRGGGGCRRMSAGLAAKYRYVGVSAAAPACCFSSLQTTWCAEQGPLRKASCAGGCGQHKAVLLYRMHGSCRMGSVGPASCAHAAVQRCLRAGGTWVGARPARPPWPLWQHAPTPPLLCMTSLPRPAPRRWSRASPPLPSLQRSWAGRSSRT